MSVIPMASFRWLVRPIGELPDSAFKDIFGSAMKDATETVLQQQFEDCDTHKRFWQDVPTVSSHDD